MDNTVLINTCANKERKPLSDVIMDSTLGIVYYINQKNFLVNNKMYVLIKEKLKKISMCYNSLDWFLLLLNLLFFMVVQMYFFRYVASKQYETVLLSKTKIVDLYISKVPSYRDTFIKQGEKYKIENNEKIENQKREREIENNSLEFKYCWLPIIITSVVSVLILLYNTTKWIKYHTIGMVFIILGYVGELLFFFTMVKPYEFIGDYTVLDELVQQIKGR